MDLKGKLILMVEPHRTSHRQFDQQEVNTASRQYHRNGVHNGISQFDRRTTTTTTAGKNVQTVLDLSAELFKQANTRIGTGRMNKAFEIIRDERTGAKRTGTAWPRVYYATQIATNPVTILMFVNNPKLFDENYLRYMAARLQALLPVGEVPVRLFSRSHRSDKRPGRKH